MMKLKDGQAYNVRTSPCVLPRALPITALQAVVLGILLYVRHIVCDTPILKVGG